MTNESERRRYKRIRKHFILTYYDLADPGARFDASQLKNISLGGMCLVTSKSFETLRTLAIELRTPLISELVHFEGVVLESKEKIKGIIYETRLEFQNLSPQAKFVLGKIINHFEREESSDHE